MGVRLANIEVPLSNEVVGSDILVLHHDFQDVAWGVERHDVRPLWCFACSVLNCALSCFGSNIDLQIGVLCHGRHTILLKVSVSRVKFPDRFVILIGMRIQRE